MGVVERRNAVVEGLDLGNALVAVFGTAQVAAVVLGVLEEGAEVRDADHVDAGADAFGVVDHRRQHHVAAVAAAHNAHAVGVEFGPAADPVEQGADVLHRVLAQQAVVQLQVGLAVTGRAAHVGHQHGHLHFVQKELRGRVEGREGLRFRTAVDAYHHRERAVAFGAVVEGGNGARLAVHFVEGGEAHQFGRTEARRIQAADFALRPARQLTAGKIDHVHVAGRGCAVERQRQALAIGREAEAADHADRQVRKRDFRVARQGQHVQLADAVLVGGVGQVAAARGDVQVGHVPGDVAADQGRCAAARVVVVQGLELALLVGNVIDAAAIGPVAEGAEAGLVAVHREQTQLAAGQVHFAGVGLVDRDVLHHQQALAVGREVHGAPHAAFLQHDARFTAGQVAHPDVVVATVARGAGPGQVF